MMWMDVSEAIDALKQHMTTDQMVEWLQRGHEVLNEDEAE